MRRTGFRERVVGFVVFAAGTLIGERIARPGRPTTMRSRLGEIYHAEIDALKEELEFANDRRIGELVLRVVFGDRRLPGSRRAGS